MEEGVREEGLKGGEEALGVVERGGGTQEFAQLGLVQEAEGGEVLREGGRGGREGGRMGGREGVSGGIHGASLGIGGREGVGAEGGRNDRKGAMRHTSMTGKTPLLLPSSFRLLTSFFSSPSSSPPSSPPCSERRAVRRRRKNSSCNAGGAWPASGGEGGREGGREGGKGEDV